MVDQLKLALYTALEQCRWKSILFHADRILAIDEKDLDALSSKAFAYVCTSKYTTLENFCASLPEDLQANTVLLRLRCRGLAESRSYQKIISLLGSPSSIPGVTDKLVESNAELSKYLKQAMFNLNQIESFHTEETVTEPDPRDPLHPQAISAKIVKAMIERDADGLHFLTVFPLKEIEKNTLMMIGCGCHRFLLGQTEGGQALLIKATELDPDVELAWLCLIDVLMSIQEWDQSLAALRKVHRRFPKSHQVGVFAISLYLKSGSQTLAWQWIKQIDQTDPFARHERAVALAMEGDFNEAIEEFQSLIDSDVDRQLLASSSLNLGTCHRRLGNFEAALQSFDSALGYGADKAECLASIGFTHHLMGNIDEAVYFYSSCLGVNPAHHFVTKMLDTAISHP